MLGVPLTLAITALAFNGLQSDRERSLALDAQREDLLQDYLDEMSALILDRHLGDDTGDTTRAAELAQTRTLSTLRSLDGARKGIVIRFLADTNLITGVDDPGELALGGGRLFLVGADLRGADLRAASLCRLELYLPDLTGANLEEADIGMSSIYRPILTDATLKGANLSGTMLTSPTLDGTDLSGATLTRTFFIEATGTGTNFTGADLRGSLWDVQLLVGAQLMGAKVTSKEEVNGALGLGAVEGKPLDPDFRGSCLDIIPFEGRSRDLLSPSPQP